MVVNFQQLLPVLLPKLFAVSAIKILGFKFCIVFGQVRAPSNILIKGCSNLPEKVTNHYPENLHFRCIVLRISSDLVPLLVDMSRSEKLS